MVCEGCAERGFVLLHDYSRLLRRYFEDYSTSSFHDRHRALVLGLSAEEYEGSDHRRLLPFGVDGPVRAVSNEVSGRRGEARDGEWEASVSEVPGGNISSGRRGEEVSTPQVSDSASVKGAGFAFGELRAGCDLGLDKGSRVCADAGNKFFSEEGRGKLKAEAQGSAAKVSDKKKKKKKGKKKSSKGKIDHSSSSGFSDLSLGGKTAVESVPEWRVSAKPLSGWAFGASDKERESLAKSLRKKWELENELKAQKLQRQLDLMNSDDLSKEIDTRRVQALARGERAKVSVEKAHKSLLVSGNVKGKVVVDVDGGGEVLGTVLKSGCSISPNSSASMKEFIEAKKKIEGLTALLLRAGIDPDKELSPSGNTCYSRSLPAEGRCDPDGPFCKLSTRNREKLLAEGRPYRIDHSIAGSDGRCEVIFADIIEDDDFGY